jgi:hypothetical protein
MSDDRDIERARLWTVLDALGPILAYARARAIADQDEVMHDAIRAAMTERRAALEGRPDAASPMFTCPGCGRDTPIVMGGRVCPDCAGREE